MKCRFTRDNQNYSHNHMWKTFFPFIFLPIRSISVKWVTESAKRHRKGRCVWVNEWRGGGGEKPRTAMHYLTARQDFFPLTRLVHCPICSPSHPKCWYKSRFRRDEQIHCTTPGTSSSICSIVTKLWENHHVWSLNLISSLNNSYHY